jgi:putative tryptophan/tyrosine transport system substrate-binding protein
MFEGQFVRRRDFITIGGAAAGWPLVARAQQPAMPIVGFLAIQSSHYLASRMPSFRQGLKEAGYIEGQNVAIEYRLAEGHYDRLPDMLADLIGRQVVMSVTSGIDPSKIAKAATTTLPIVFITDVDPVETGLVASLNRPGGNITGISLLGSALEGKRLGLVNEIVSGTAPIGVLLDSRFPDADRQLRELQDTAGAIKRQIIAEWVTNEPEIEAAFANIARQRAAALLVAQNASFANFMDQLAALAGRYKLPAMYTGREFAEAGGLVSYGPDFADGYHHAGLYAAKILKGMKPADLPVMQSIKYPLVINLKTAKALGFDIPAKVLAISDEVIE